MSDHPDSNTTLENTAILPAGFSAGGLHCGVKPRNPDLALLVSDRSAALAGTFTANRVQASCVTWCRDRVASGKSRAVVVNSGNANACTGEQGVRDTESMAARTAQAIGCSANEVCVSSTGTIGLRLPMDHISKGIDALALQLSTDHCAQAATAIMTTDTVPKVVSTVVDIDETPCRITGLAKGSGMIHPDMATMLAYILTDAFVPAPLLQVILHEAVNQSFNRITVDGDRSTNDTVLMFANRAAGAAELHRTHPDADRFIHAIKAVCLNLALRIVRDGEGASKLVTLKIKGARNDKDADRAARAVGNSLLIKTSWAGSDPNWGRILCAIGYSGAQVDPGRIDIDYENIAAVRGGQEAGKSLATLKEIAARDTFTIVIDLNQGIGSATLYACDTTEAYVRINVEE